MHTWRLMTDFVACYQRGIQLGTPAAHLVFALTSQSVFFFPFFHLALKLSNTTS